MWALGCVLYELATLKRAFDGQSLPALIVRILKVSTRVEPHQYLSMVGERRVRDAGI